MREKEVDWDENEELEGAETEDSEGEGDDGGETSSEPEAQAAAAEPLKGKRRGRRAKGDQSAPPTGAGKVVLRLPKQAGGFLEVEAAVVATRPNGSLDLRPIDPRYEVCHGVLPFSPDSADRIHYRLA